MAKANLQFGEFRPDIALLDNQFTATADNVFPGLNSYKPIPGLVPITTSTLAGAKGLFAARKQDGTWQVYGGTATKLYKWTSGGGWVDISRLAGGAYNCTDLWSFTQFGTTVIAVQLGDVPQSIDTEAGGNFAALGGTPPTARHVAVIGDFVVLSGLSSNQRKLRWSAIGSATGWTVGTNLCDEQEFLDNGPVQGVSGSETSAYVVQDRGIRSMQFLPGDTTFIFQFTRIVKERGSISKYGFTTVAEALYFLAEDGFYVLAGGQLIPIGQDKINDFFIANSDIGRRNQVLCFGSSKPYIIFPFFSTASAPAYDRWMIYNWVTQRWATATVSALVWGMLASTGVDLDTDSGETGDAILDTAGLPSLDSFAYVGGRPVIMAIDPSGLLSSLTGPNLQAVLETAEAHLTPGMRSYVTDVYPLIDAPGCTIAVAARETLQEVATYGAEIPLEVTGAASVFNSGRLHRFRCTAPASVAWTNAQGVLAEVQPDGFA